jgi:hypothetical protein
MSEVQKERYLKFLVENGSHYAKPDVIESWLDKTIQSAQDLGIDDVDARVKFLVYKQCTVNQQPAISATDLMKIVKADKGEYDVFGTIQDMMRSKMFLQVEESDVEGQMRMDRGVELEDLICEKYLKKTGYVIDTEAEEQLYQFVKQGGHPDYPMLIGNPDRIVRDLETNRRIVVDFKSIGDTKRVEDWEYQRGRDNDYQDQLATYKGLCELAGIKIDAVQLAPHTLDPWKLHVIDIKIPEGRVDYLFGLAKKYAGMIERGEVPAFTRRTNEEILKNVPQYVKDNVNEYVLANALEKVAVDEKDFVKEKLMGSVVALGVDLEAGNVNVGGLSFKETSRKTTNNKGIIGYLMDQLIEAGHDEDNLLDKINGEEFKNVSSSNGVAFPRSKKSEMYQRVESEKENMAIEMMSIKERHLSAVASMDKGQSLDDEFDNALGISSKYDESLKPF